MMEPYNPAYLMDIGTEMNAIPTYILIKLAAVRNQDDLRAAMASGVRCL